MVCEAASLEQRYISLVGVFGIFLDADEQGAFGLAVEILVFIYYMYNIEGYIRRGSQVQVREWIRSRYHSKSSVTNNKTNNRQYVEAGHINDGLYKQ